MAKEKNEENDEEIIVKKPGDSRIIIMMILCMAVIVLTPAGVYYSMGAFMNTAAETVEKEPDDYTEVVMDKITVNTAGSIGSHFIQVEITLHLSDPEMAKLFEEPKDGNKSLKRVFKAKVIDTLRVRNIKEFDGSAAQKKKLEDDLMRILNDTKNQMAADVTGQIFRLFFSEYTIQ